MSFALGFAAFLAWCAAAPTRVRAGLVATDLALAGFVSGRPWDSRSTDGRARSSTW